MQTSVTESIDDAFSPLLPERAAIGEVLDDESRTRLESSWAELTALGFEVGVDADHLRVRHRDRGFETVIQLSRPDDLGELRSLFLALRNRFGRVRDRWMPWLFLPGKQVTVPYENLRLIIGTCQKLRKAH